jgi:hypothetical protein
MIHLGFQVGSGEPVEVPEGHTIFLGLTQHGKTSTLVGMAARSGYACLAFSTKVREASFDRIPRELNLLHPTAPYYEDSLDWQDLRNLCEAVTGDAWDRFDKKALRSMLRKGKFGLRGSKRFTQWSKPRTIDELLDNLDIALENASGNRADALGSVQGDLQDALAELKPLKKKCRVPELKIGINLVDLVRQPEHLQSTVVASMIRWVRSHRERTIIALPEAWKFTDARRKTAVGEAAKHYIREGASAKNFLWIDSQTIGGLNWELLSQCQIWLFGVQKWSRELQHALDAMPDHYWPDRTDIQTLGKGEFLVCWDRYMVRTYVQPAWMNSTHAQAIARHEVDIESAEGIRREFDRQQRVSV